MTHSNTGNNSSVILREGKLPKHNTSRVLTIGDDSGLLLSPTQHTASAQRQMKDNMPISSQHAQYTSSLVEAPSIHLGPENWNRKHSLKSFENQSNKENENITLIFLKK